MEKPTQAAIDAFANAFPAHDDRAVQKKMFGCPAAFVNGNMFCGVFHNGLTFRLPADRLVALSELDGVGEFEPMPGRPWKEYIFANPEVCAAADLASWAGEALNHTATMPPKKPRAKKAKKA